mmetsp:Transcript_20300/g.60346  ORF Transcript_20300/g.60346 Transcript_20300/m.60346 type:complete len:234 (+) Transcript_20300:2278-2979(+)
MWPAGHPQTPLARGSRSSGHTASPSSRPISTPSSLNSRANRPCVCSANRTVYTPSPEYCTSSGESRSPPELISRTDNSRASIRLGRRWPTGIWSMSQAVNAEWLCCPTGAEARKAAPTAEATHRSGCVTRPHSAKLVLAWTARDTCSGCACVTASMAERTSMISVSTYGVALSRCPEAERTSPIGSCATPPTSPISDGSRSHGLRACTAPALTISQRAGRSQSLPCRTSVALT